MMFSTYGSIASQATMDFNFSDELVVVGRVPMNAKRGKKQLQKIADRRETSFFQPQIQRDPKPSSNKRGKQPKAQQQQQKFEKQPKAQQLKHTQTRDEPLHEPLHVMEVEPVVVGAALARAALAELPEEVLTHVMLFTAVDGVGACAATGRAAHAVFWAAPSAGLWHGLGCGKAPLPWDAFRRWRFGLERNWLVALENSVMHDPLAALQRCVAICGALLRSERAEARALCELLSVAAARSDAAPGLELLDSALAKINARPEVYVTSGTVRAARDQAKERCILDRLDTEQQREHEAMMFDYFADDAVPQLDEPTNFWDELENLAFPAKADFDEPCESEVCAAPQRELPEAESRALAAEFLEAMGLHHGFDWQETVAAMDAIQQ